MSKSAGGGGLKGHDKGGGGGVKVVKKNNGLEAALENVPDACLCPSGHRMKLHNGSKREGNLTCDGPDEICCGAESDGVLRVGEPRYTCVACDFDICKYCFDVETGEDKTPEQLKEEARQRLREKTGRAPKKEDAITATPPSAAAPEAKAASPLSLEEKRAQIAAQVLAAKAAVGDAALHAAMEAGSLDGLREALKSSADCASAAVLADARKARDKLLAKAKKSAQKARRSSGGDATHQAGKEESEPTATDGPATPATATAAAAPPASPDASVPARTVLFATPTPAQPTTPPPVTPFAFDFSKVTSAQDSDDSDEEDEEEDNEEDDEEESNGSETEAQATLPTQFPLPAPENPLVCPFTKEVMREPVVLADGHTYEKAAVTRYLETHDLSPRTGESLPHKSVLPNLMAEELCKLALRFDEA